VPISRTGRLVKRARRLRLPLLAPVIAAVFVMTGFVLPSSASASSTYNFVICGPSQTPGSLGGAAAYGFTSYNFCDTPSNGFLSGTATFTTEGGAGYNPIWWSAPSSEYFTTFSWNALSVTADMPSNSTSLLPGNVKFQASGSGSWLPDSPAVNSCADGPDWNYYDGQSGLGDCSVSLGKSSESLYSGTYGNTGTFWMIDSYDSASFPGTESFSVTNPVLTVFDPNTTAALSTSGSLWSDLGSTTTWYNGTTLNALSQTATASDPGGACFLQPTLTATTGSESAQA
jgi:hypothetical protein